MNFVVNIAPTLLFTVAVVNILLGVMILSRGYRHRTHIFFSLLSFSVGIWSVAIAGFYSETIPLHLEWVKWTHAAALTTALFFLSFTTHFPERLLKSTLPRVAAMIVYSVLMALIVSSDVIVGQQEQKGIHYEIHGGYLFYAVVLVVFFAAGFYFLYKQRSRASQLLLKRQISYVLLGSMTASTLALITDLVFPYFGIFHFTWVGPLFTLILVVSIFIAILRYHLFDIKLIVTELLTLIVIVILFIRLVNAVSLADIIVSAWILITVSVFGYLLLKGVYHEIDQRLQLQSLTDRLRETNLQLEDANHQLRSVNEKLKKLDKAKTEFLSITSHQLRTPLTGIKGYLSMMIEGDFGKFSEQQEEVMERISEEVDRLARMVQVFLNVSRIESGRLIIAKLDCDLADIIRTVVKEFEPVAEKKKLELKYVGPAHLPYKGDSDKLKDVMMNLVDNAIKYTPSGKVLIGAGAQTSGEIWIKVEDTGVGIDPAEREKLFEKFSRAEGIAEVSAEGSGLGLFIVRKIVEAHGGTVSVFSEGRAKGAVFTVTLPKPSA